MTPGSAPRPTKETDPLFFPYYDWPEPLNGLLMQGATKAQKDALLLAGITIMGGMFGYNLYQKYHLRCIFPNLQTYIAAPTAWDKERLLPVRTMYEWIENKVQEDNDKEYSHYLDCLQYYNDSVAEDRFAVTPKPMPPLERKFLLSGTQRCLEIKEGMVGHCGRGLIVEMEAEPVANAVADEYWHWQDAMRRNFDNECLYLPKRKDYKDAQACCPALSVLLSGSYETLQKLISRVSNCLFSQQLLYSMPIDKGYHSSYISPQEQNAKYKAYRIALDALKIIYDDQTQHKTSLQLCLFTAQYDKIRDVFSGLKRMVARRYGDALDSLVDKLEINVMRIIMVVAALRRYSEGTAGLYLSSAWAYAPSLDTVLSGYELRVSEEDLDACLGLVYPLFYQSTHVAEKMSDEIAKLKVEIKRDDIMAIMGDTFTSKEFLATTRQYGIPDSTSKNWIRSRYKDIKCLGGGVINKIGPKKK